ncbi:MAG: Aminoglycoside N(6')-acetyltransferase type 1 [Syntrophorhabdaceae bacterium PtaU1.Bin034]|jgi:RimJ/RimL family protein N-acetyltransferase|nr:MAG: Aminoglycoside N(6')-acetyltransferase type 1 [Syntrophorhabdaceae bacterium PtaU1.Bin034]
MNSHNAPPRPFARGRKVFLRDDVLADIEKYVYWKTHGEWREYDAPWEGIWTSLNQEQQEKLIRRFIKSCNTGIQVPRKRATIATLRDNPIGWVSRYVRERFPDVWYVGIDIAEDNYLNKGIGTEALGLWVDYLFTDSTVHKIALDTWSFNTRMMRVAEKLGFMHEGVERELIQWRGQRLDLIHFGMLRREWEEKRRAARGDNVL